MSVKAYRPLELGLPGTEACPDKYTAQSTLYCPKSRRLFLQVMKQAVFVQLGYFPQGVGTSHAAVQWGPEQPREPMIAELAREFDAIRVRNYTAGSEAQVMVSAE